MRLNLDPVDLSTDSVSYFKINCATDILKLKSKGGPVLNFH